jgi:hypothetical protein
MPWLLLMLGLLLPNFAPAQDTPAPASPEWLVRQYVTAVSWPERARYYTGELAEHYATSPTLGELGVTMRPGSPRQLLQTADIAVFAVALSPEMRPSDMYLYLRRTHGEWRLEALRALALPLVVYDILDSLEARQRLPDSLKAFVARMRLTTSTDSALKAFFVAKAARLQQVADAFEREHVDSVSAADRNSPAPTQSLKDLYAQLADLNFAGVYRDSDAAGCMLLKIGGLIDNEVGFMYCPEGALPPSMSPVRFILVEPVANGWFLYKTT